LLWRNPKKLKKLNENESIEEDERTLALEEWKLALRK
jgi:hypothetical protein